MCGRALFIFDQSKTSKQIQKQIERIPLGDFKTGELFPSERLLTIIPAKDGKIDLAVKKWGFKSNGANNGLLINAKIETLEYKPTFQPFIKQRCAVIVNGFYEWKNKEKHYIFDSNSQYFYLACIYNNQDEFVVLTHESDGELSKIHNRSPLILNQKEMIAYLHGKHFNHSSSIPLIIRNI